MIKVDKSINHCVDCCHYHHNSYAPEPHICTRIKTYKFCIVTGKKTETIHKRNCEIERKPKVFFGFDRCGKAGKYFAYRDNSNHYKIYSGIK